MCLSKKEAGSRKTRKRRERVSVYFRGDIKRAEEAWRVSYVTSKIEKRANLL